MADAAPDLARLLDDLVDARADLRDAVSSLTDAGLDRPATDEWSVRTMIEHVIISELLYARGVQVLRGGESDTGRPEASASTVAEALQELQRSRAALTLAANGVDADVIDRMQPLGNDQYSVRWFLEHSAEHDREHAAHIRAATP